MLSVFVVVLVETVRVRTTLTIFFCPFYRFHSSNSFIFHVFAQPWDFCIRHISRKATCSANEMPTNRFFSPTWLILTPNLKVSSSVEWTRRPGWTACSFSCFTYYYSQRPLFKRRGCHPDVLRLTVTAILNSVCRPLSFFPPFPSRKIPGLVIFKMHLSCRRKQVNFFEPEFSPCTTRNNCAAWLVPRFTEDGPGKRTWNYAEEKKRISPQVRTPVRLFS